MGPRDGCEFFFARRERYFFQPLDASIQVNFLANALPAIPMIMSHYPRLTVDCHLAIGTAFCMLDVADDALVPVWRAVVVADEDLLVERKQLVEHMSSGCVMRRDPVTRPGALTRQAMGWVIRVQCLSC